MAKYKGIFKCTILSSKRVIYENEVQSVFLTGNDGEYELLACHYPLIGVLAKGPVVINNKERIQINGGIARFFANECIIMIDEQRKPVKAEKK